MTRLQQTKEQLRKDIAILKRAHSKDTLCDFSGVICRKLEEQDLFRQASCIAFYHALPDEVQTQQLVEKWHLKKKILLPVVCGNELELHPCTNMLTLQEGSFGILEPVRLQREVALSQIDLMIVPGVAFDRFLNRLGRGKGYYDRLLTQVKAPKIGLCFDFQLQEHIPIEPFDIPVDMVITESEIL